MEEQNEICKELQQHSQVQDVQILPAFDEEGNGKLTLPSMVRKYDWVLSLCQVLKLFVGVNNLNRLIDKTEMEWQPIRCP